MILIKDNYIPWMKLILALYVLKILESDAAYGNKIAEAVKKCTSNVINPNTNALYPLLRVMEERGYITGSWDNPDRRSKRIYHITEAGRQYVPILEKKVQERLNEMESTIAILRKNLFESDRDIK